MTQLKVELGQEEDGRWIGEVPAIPGVMAYGQTRAALQSKLWPSRFCLS